MTASVVAPRSAAPRRTAWSPVPPRRPGCPTSRLAADQGGQVERAGAGHPEVGVPEAAEILHGGQQARADHLDHGPDRSTNRTRVPGASRAGGIPVRVEQGQIGAPDQPPAARRGSRVDAGVRVAQRDRAGRHPGPRCLQPRHGQLVGQPGEVGPARAEAAEGDPKLRRRPAGPLLRADQSPSAGPHRADRRRRSPPGSRPRGPRSGAGRRWAPPRTRSPVMAGIVESVEQDRACPGHDLDGVQLAGRAAPFQLGEPAGRVVDLEEQRAARRQTAAARGHLLLQVARHHPPQSALWQRRHGRCFRDREKGHEPCEPTVP